jgi:serine/threonine protein kinase
VEGASSRAPTYPPWPSPAPVGVVPCLAVSADSRAPRLSAPHPLPPTSRLLPAARLQGSSELDQLNGIFKLLGTPSESSWPKFSSLRAVQMGLLGPFAEHHTISLGPDGALCKLPKNMLRKRLPAEGYTPALALQAAQAAQAAAQAAAASGAAPPPPPPCLYKTTALGDSGYELLNSMLTCDPERRSTAAAALHHAWFSAEPLPQPLSRAEIRQMRRQRDEAIASGAHQQAIAQQRAQAASKVAAEHAATIAASIQQRFGFAR